VEIHHYCRLLFNYFDSIAIGLAQDLYIEPIVVEHLGSIMLTWRKSIPTIEHKTVQAFVIGLPKFYERFEALASRLTPRGLEH
jgi:hypothetical protein